MLRKLAQSPAAKSLGRAYLSTSSLCLDSQLKVVKGDTVQKSLAETINPKVKLPDKITVQVADDLTRVTGVPDEYTYERRVRIYMPTRNMMQSGTAKIHHWKIEFDTRERWENPLMGWSSSGDSLSNIDMNMVFPTRESAMRFCEKNGWEYEVAEPQTATFVPKNYGDNFSWNKRVRKPCK